MSCFFLFFSFSLRWRYANSKSSALGFINLIWPHFFGGCDICRPTDEWLLRAGEWDKVDLKPGVGEGKYDTLPHVVGTLTKRG